MEWLVLALLAVLAAAVIGAPLWHPDRATAEPGGADELVEEHRRLLAELRELDDDAAGGRVSAAERQAGRRALAPRLRAVTEALREAGVDARSGA
jgi:cytochrome c-type biogenesis protein CcmH/NrfG